jgi:hypothetical protein
VVEQIREAWSSEIYPPAASIEWYDIMDALRTALDAALAEPEPSVKDSLRVASEDEVEAMMPRPAPSLEFLDGFRAALAAAPPQPDAIARAVEAAVKECVTICERQRAKILKNPVDPSWTEHLAEVQSAMKQRFGVEMGYPIPPEPEHIHTCPPDCQKPLCVNRRREVAAAVEAEREACAKIADSEIKNTAILTVYPGKSAAAWDIANAIRARGSK